MRSYRILVALSLGFCCHAAMATDCGSYTGARTAIGKDIAVPVGKGLASLRTKSASGLFSISDKQILLLRRTVSGGGDSRTGNVRLFLRPRDLDSSLNIRIGNQIFPDFSGPALFDSLDTGTAIAVQRDVCEDARLCTDFLPASEEIPFMLKSLLECNQNGKALYVFNDGLFVTDMRIMGDQMPVGSALFFAKRTGGYRLAGLIIQR